MKKYKSYLGITEDMWKEVYFNKNIVKEKDKEFLEMFYEKHNGKASASELTKPYGKHPSAYNKRVAALGKRVATYFNIKDIPQKEEWWNVIFYGEKKEHFIWELRAELRKVIGQYKNIESNKDDDVEYTEGRIKSITLNTYERNISARRECLKHYGYVCVVCNENLEKKYGSKIGKNFIHVHHVMPMGERKEEYKVNGIRDLKPVCPNCHAIIHRKKPCFKIEELKSEIEKVKILDEFKVL